MIAPRAQQASILPLNNCFNFVVNLFQTFGSKSTRLYHHHQKSCIGYLFLFVLVFVIAHCWLDVLYCYQAVVVSGGVQPGKPADRTRGNDPQTFFNPSSPFLRFSPQHALSPGLICLLHFKLSARLQNLSNPYSYLSRSKSLAARRILLEYGFTLSLLLVVVVRLAKTTTMLFRCS